MGQTKIAERGKVLRVQKQLSGSCLPNSALGDADGHLYGE